MYLEAAKESLLFLIWKNTVSCLACATIREQIILLHLLTTAKNILDLQMSATKSFCSTFNGLQFIQTLLLAGSKTYPPHSAHSPVSTALRMLLYAIPRPQL